MFPKPDSDGGSMQSEQLTHPCRFVDADFNGEGVVGREHGGNGGRGVGHADPVRHTAR